MKVRTDLRMGWWYTVKGGDSLSKIAYNTYGDATLWPRIYSYKNNRQIIGANPDLLRAGISIQLW